MIRPINISGQLHRPTGVCRHCIVWYTHRNTPEYCFVANREFLFTGQALRRPGAKVLFAVVVCHEIVLREALKPFQCCRSSMAVSKSKGNVRASECWHSINLQMKGIQTLGRVCLTIKHVRTQNYLKSVLIGPNRCKRSKML